jgi:hypothetical protein
VNDRPANRRDFPSHGASRGIIAGAGRAAAGLIAALVLAVLFEWVGMHLWWPEEGAGHSERLLSAEWRHLDPDAGAVSREAAASVRRWVAVLGSSVSAIYASICRAATCMGTLADLSPYIRAMSNIGQVFVVRLMVLAAATPLIVLCAMVGLVEGLLHRDLRRWGGGRESSFVYHRCKRSLGPLLLLAPSMYLAAPISVHPSWALAPTGAALAVLIAAVSATFKKYL